LNEEKVAAQRTGLESDLRHRAVELDSVLDHPAVGLAVALPDLAAQDGLGQDAAPSLRPARDRELQAVGALRGRARRESP
jgi:hypothetical protein